MPTAAEARAALTAASGIAGHTWPRAEERLRRLVSECGLLAPAAVANWVDVFELLDGVAATLAVFEPTVFAIPLNQLAVALAPASKGTFSRIAAGLGNSAYRTARKQLRASLKPSVKLSSRELYRAVTAAAGQQLRWAELSIDGSSPRLPTGLAEVKGAYGQLSTELRALGAYAGAADLDRLAAETLTALLGELAADTETLFRLPELTRLRAALGHVGLGPLVDELGYRHLDGPSALHALEWVWLASILDHVSIDDPQIGAFDGELHRRNVADFATPTELTLRRDLSAFVGLSRNGSRRYATCTPSNLNW